MFILFSIFFLINDRLFTTLYSSLSLVKIVGRAKKILDFTVTSTLIHFVICLSIFSIPYRWEWWVIQIICVILQTIIAECICARIEMAEDPLIRLSQVKVV